MIFQVSSDEKRRVPSDVKSATFDARASSRMVTGTPFGARASQVIKNEVTNNTAHITIVKELDVIENTDDDNHHLIYVAHD